MKEQVLVVPRDALFPGREPPFHGFRPAGVTDVVRAVSRLGTFVDRDLAEDDPSLKQIIPYGLIVQGSDVFIMKRSSKGGDPRLHEKISLGVGGHVNPSDRTRADEPRAVQGLAALAGDLAEAGTDFLAVAAAFQRELDEELVVESAYRSEVLGVLNDDSNPVGRVHLGLVFRLRLEDPRVRVREVDVLTGLLVPAERVWTYGPSMETWSRILQEHFWPRPGSTKGSPEEPPGGSPRRWKPPILL